MAEWSDGVRRFKRRTLLAGMGAATVGAAGCVSDDDADDTGSDPADDADDGSDPADDADDGSDPADDADDADDGETGDDEYPEFDPSDPEFPQLLSTLMEHEYQFGHIDDLDAFEERDEPVYGGPVWDPPEDEDEWIEPDTLIFSLTPIEDPGIYDDLTEPIMDTMEEETGIPVEYFGAQTYAAQVEAMRSERLHVAGFSTGPLPFAVNMAGAIPVGIQVGEETFGYRLWAIAHADSDINSVEDFAGRNVAHGDPASNSGHLMPQALFTDEFGVEPGEDYEIEHIGSHENMVLAVYHGDNEAAPVCSYCILPPVDEGNVDPDDIKVVWSSDPIPTTCYSYRYNLHPEIAEGIERTFLEHEYYDTEFAEHFDGRGAFAEIDYATHWHDILVTHEDNGIDYEDEDEID